MPLISLGSRGSGIAGSACHGLCLRRPGSVVRCSWEIGVPEKGGQWGAAHRGRGARNRALCSRGSVLWGMHHWDEQRCSGRSEARSGEELQVWGWEGYVREGQQEQKAAAGLNPESTPSTTVWGAGAGKPLPKHRPSSRTAATL